MDMKQRNLVEEVALRRLAVVHVHKFARDQPAGDATFCHPGVRKAKEMAVEASEAAELEAARFQRPELQADFLGVRHVMLTNVRRVADKQINAGRGVRVREVGEVDMEARAFPQFCGGAGGGSEGTRRETNSRQ